MKAMIKTVMGLSVLLVMAGCLGRYTTERSMLNCVDNFCEWASRINRNEVVYCLDRIHPQGVSVGCVEKTYISKDGHRVSDVYVDGDPSIVQAYCIKNRTVTNCRWTYRWNDRRDFATDEEYQTARAAYGAFRNKEQAMKPAFHRLPNRLEQGNAYSLPLSNAPVVTVTSMGWGPWASPPASEETGPVSWTYWSARHWTSFYRDGDGFMTGYEVLDDNGNYVQIDEARAKTITFSTWNHWTVRQWAGRPDDAPAEIGALCQAVVQMLSTPECKQRYRSYFRVVPLFTKAELEAEKKTPLINLEKSPYYVRRAIASPYILFPVFGGGRPFPSAWKYKPGDKFKFRDGNNYYLIETFKGGK